MLLPTTDSAWIALVNDVLVGDRGVALWDEWFASVDQYLETTETACGIEVIPAQAVRAGRNSR